MAPSILYTSTVLGAIALYLLLRPGPRAFVKVPAVILGLAALAWLVKESVAVLGTPAGREPEPFFVLFSLIAIAAAVRMITHNRPVYAALYFVMVVLSSAGLFLLLEAEFMAFALVIVYAGAILITYLFVLMLARQAPEAGQEEQQPEYDIVPREPAVAVAVGFVMLALLADTFLGGVHELPAPPSAAEVRAGAWRELNRLPDRIKGATAEIRAVADAGGSVGPVDDEGALWLTDPDTGHLRIIELPESALPENIERVGLSLIADFPASLELAGVILLLAMYGAVVMARRQIELSEEEKRQAAGGSP